MANIDPADLSAVDAARKIAAGSLTAEALMRACLERIKSREPQVQAFEHLAVNEAICAAQALDKGPSRGPLHGLPFAAKDTYDTHDMPTTCGSPIYAGNRPACDAATVALTRAAGGILVGKAVTTEFAYFTPGKTRNPHDPSRTPGGSSSGSAAAVGAHMVPLAFGSQTVGSVIRPAAFCGAAAYKPSFGMVPAVGLKAMAWSLDTVGVFGHTVEDCALLVGALLGADFLAALERAEPPRVGLCRTLKWGEAQLELTTVMEEARNRFSKAGATVSEIDMPAGFGPLYDAQVTVLAYEMARVFAPEAARHHKLLSARFQEQLAKGREISHAEYARAKAIADGCRAQLASLFGSVDVLVAPASPGEAPVGHGYTGNPIFNGIWTLLGVPCVSMPGLTGPNGLPVGLQAIGRVGDDARTLAAAHWLSQRLA
jgi:Asp-tRNA(Asn)/Glu-tRNA(Gln) amidotransferase A subunit family amidase